MRKPKTCGVSRPVRSFYIGSDSTTGKRDRTKIQSQFNQSKQ